ncbi:hypothetical protein ACG1BZ_07205 [Microbulbifer sp. CNSA002]|uniref:hypothetical protein n=1 Tax=unclassified Microbulbifer TaxID=2619833 RepID=UPI0039B38B6D
MTFKTEVLKAAKVLEADYPGWKFLARRYKSRPAKFCDFLIVPFWTFSSPPASVLIQPKAGIYLREVEDIVSELTGLPRGKVPTFTYPIDSSFIDESCSKKNYYPRVYVKDFGSQEEAVEEVMRGLDNIIETGQEYLNKQFALSSKESLYQSIPEMTRGHRCICYCVVRGLLGDTDYIERVLRKEIDPKGYQDLEIVGKVLDYFS